MSKFWSKKGMLRVREFMNDPSHMQIQTENQTFQCTDSSSKGDAFCQFRHARGSKKYTPNFELLRASRHVHHKNKHKDFVNSFDRLQ